MSISEVVNGGAAVVQAVGSILAIMAATKIASRQADRDQRLRREELLDRVKSVTAMVKACRDAVQAFQTEVLMLPAHQGLKLPRADILNSARVSVNLVSVIRPELAPTPLTAVVVLKVQTAIVNSALAIPHPDAGFHVGYTKALEHFCRALESASDELDAEIARISSN